MASRFALSLVVARRPGTHLMLAGSSGMSPQFEGLSHRTIFFTEETAEAELRKLRVDPESVELRRADLEVILG